MKIALLSIEDLSGYVTDDKLLIEPLQDLGHIVEFVPWQARVKWRTYDGVVIRTTWDYQNHLAAFLRVLRRVHKETRLANPLKLVEWNVEKSIYLTDLEQRGARIIPSIWRRGKIERRQIRKWFDQLQTDQLVIKPTVGANAQDTLIVKRDQENIQRLKLTFDDRSCVVQPFMSGIVREGEFSLFYFNGEYSHAILKTPKREDFRVQEEHGGRIRAIKPSANLLATGKKILNLISPIPLFARVDLVRTEDNDFAIVELELIEPSMYLRKSKRAPYLFAKAIDEWLLS
ncbi:MAG TPA: hypothetical protein VJT15_01280 [Pyrinomonadaceae bacterium]|nr:hypothetical protein [Pyrinomonadaceae bacterium]